MSPRTEQASKYPSTLVKQQAEKERMKEKRWSWVSIYLSIYPFVHILFFVLLYIQPEEAFCGTSKLALCCVTFQLVLIKRIILLLILDLTWIVSCFRGLFRL